MILLTGATGYIGSHVWLQLLDAGYSVVGVDNFSNSEPKKLDALKKIAPHHHFNFIQADIRDISLILGLEKYNHIKTVMHFAALKSVGESNEDPLHYYKHNIAGLINLLDYCAFFADVKSFIFSSSATVYGIPQYLPIDEKHSLSVTNPYGQTKLMGENILRDIEKANSDFKVAYLRYFNPVGSHHSGLIKEEPQEIPNNLMPYIRKVGTQELEYLNVFGDDYETIDGTGVRDYIHVEDLASGHVSALQYLQEKKESITVNLGTGTGYSVLQMIQAYEQVTGLSIPYRIQERRQGDVASCYSDASKALNLLGWKAKKGLIEMCETV